MKKPKQKKLSSQTVSSFLDTYDKHQLAAALASMQLNDIAWALFEAFAKAKAAYHGSSALNLVGHGSTQVEAAYAAGNENGIRELISVDLPNFVKQLRGEAGVVVPQEPDEE